LALSAIALFLAVAPRVAAEPAFRNLSPAEAAAIDSGEVLIRTVRDARSLGLAAASPAADELRSRIAAIRPNYLSEVMAAFPAADDAAASALFARLAAGLSDVEGYVGIPYYSKRNKTTYDLFDKLVVQSRAALPDGESIVAIQHMEPFDDYAARYEYRLVGPARKLMALTFSGVSLGPIIYSYRNLRAVEPGNMVWELYAFRDGDRVLFYGVGAVRAFDLFGAIRDRLEPSFTGRIQAFFDHMSRLMRG